MCAEIDLGGGAGRSMNQFRHDDKMDCGVHGGGVIMALFLDCCAVEDKDLVVLLL